MPADLGAALRRILRAIPLKELTVLLLYAVVISALFLPVLFSITEASFGLDSPDKYIHFWDFWWGGKSLVDLHTSFFFTDYISYPAGTSLWRSNSGFLLSYFTVPIQAICQDQNLTYNLTILFSLLINSMCGYALGMKLFKDRYVSFVVGLLVSLNPLVYAQIMLGFLEFLNIGFGLLYLLYTIELLEKRDIRSALLSFFWYCVAASWCWYMGYLLALFTLLLVASRLKDLLVHRRERWVSLALWIGLLGLFNGFVYAQLSDGGTRGGTQRELENLFFESEEGGSIELSREDFELISVDIEDEEEQTSRSVPLGWLDLKLRNSVDAWFLLNKSDEWFERHLNFAYWILLLLLSALAWKVREKNTVLFLAGSVLFFLLSLGPCLVFHGEAYLGTRWFMPYSLLSSVVPGMGRVQFPVRFLFVSTISMVVLSGYGLRRLFQCTRYGARGKVVLVSLISLLSILALRNQYDFEIPTGSIEVPEFYEKISKEPEDYAILEVPLSRGMRIGHMPGSFLFGFLQTVHNKRRMGGHIPAFLESRSYPEEIRRNALLDALETLPRRHPGEDEAKEVELPSPDELREGADVLRKYRYRYVIVHERMVPPGSRDEMSRVLHAVFGQPEEDHTTDDHLSVYKVR